MKLHQFSWPSDLRLEIEPDEYPGETFVFVSESYQLTPQDKKKIVFRSREIAIILFFFASCKEKIKSSLYRFKKELGNKRFFLSPDKWSESSKWRKWEQREIRDKWNHEWSDKQKEIYEKTRKMVIWLVGPLGESPLAPGSTNLETKRYAWSVAASEADKGGSK